MPTEKNVNKTTGGKKKENSKNICPLSLPVSFVRSYVYVTDRLLLGFSFIHFNRVSWFL
jgi:hypothetical protein